MHLIQASILALLFALMNAKTLPQGTISLGGVVLRPRLEGAKSAPVKRLYHDAETLAKKYDGQITEWRRKGVKGRQSEMELAKMETEMKNDIRIFGSKLLTTRSYNDGIDEGAMKHLIVFFQKIAALPAQMHCLIMGCPTDNNENLSTKKPMEKTTTTDSSAIDSTVSLSSSESTESIYEDK